MIPFGAVTVINGSRQYRRQRTAEITAGATVYADADLPTANEKVVITEHDAADFYKIYYNIDMPEHQHSGKFWGKAHDVAALELEDLVSGMRVGSQALRTRDDDPDFEKKVVDYFRQVQEEGTTYNSGTIRYDGETISPHDLLVQHNKRRRKRKEVEAK